MGEAHPEVKRVRVQGGKFTIPVRPWTMAQRRELKTMLADLFDKILVMDDPNAKISNVDLVQIFAKAEDEVADIVQTTIQNDLPNGCEWDNLYWEDLPVLAQAIWQTSIARGTDGGLAGKAVSVLAQIIAEHAGLPTTNSESETSKKSPASPSSPDGGEPTPRPSATD